VSYCKARTLVVDGKMKTKGAQPQALLECFRGSELSGSVFYGVGLRLHAVIYGRSHACPSHRGAYRTKTLLNEHAISQISTLPVSKVNVE